MFMKQKMQQFLFGSSFTANTTANIAWLLFRIHIGISMCLDAGWGKVKNITPPDWIVKQVAGLGFNFISPTFWAFLSCWGEFLGGIFIAIGFLTRLSALQLAFQFFVIAFIWFPTPDLLVGMYFQQLLFWGYVLVLAFGGGKYSIDYLIFTKKIKKIVVNPLPKMVIGIAFLFVSCNVQSQKPLKGSGIIVNKTYDFAGFNKLNFKDLDGKIEVEIGKPFSINIAIDDNLENLLKLDNGNGSLEIKLAGNRNNNMYIEKTHIKIKITMPNITELEHSGNSSLVLNNVNENYLKFKALGNGSCSIIGKVNKLDVIVRGNANVDAIKLIAQVVAVKRSGNGNVYINTHTNFDASSSGNGNIENYGKGIAVIIDQSGNGSIVNKELKD